MERKVVARYGDDGKLGAYERQADGTLSFIEHVGFDVQGMLIPMLPIGTTDGAERRYVPENLRQ